MRWIALVLLGFCAAGCYGLPVDGQAVEHAFDGRPGGFVMMDAASADVLRVDEARCGERLPPCSTFKIWNTMIALELGLVTSPGDDFWTWDGERRFIEVWNQDLTLGRAFAESCVPAFQALARQTGPQRMQSWLERIDYGDTDISSGVDVFWLPRPGRKTILISADEQAQLLRQLVRGELPFAPDEVAVLRDIMRVRTTERGELFGKTGSGRLEQDPRQVAWFVGWVELAEDGGTYVFACVMRGEGMTGREVRAIVESILEAGGAL